MTGTIEKKIRIKASLIYIVVALICSGMVVFALQFRKNLDRQKEQVEQYKRELLLAEEFIREVNTAQSAINQYAATRMTQYYTNYQQHLERVDSLIYSLNLTTQDFTQNRKLDTIRMLLKSKGQVVTRLNRQLTQENPIGTINQVLRGYVPPHKTQSYTITTTQKDTVTNVPKKRGFWKRFSDLFSPKAPDTMQTVTTVKTEMVKLPSTDSLPIVPKIKGYAAKASSSYTDQIQSIEKHIRELIASDQKLSFQISNLLIDFYSQTVYSRLEETQKSEQWIRKNNLYSIFIGITALALILVFILLIISDVNQGYRARKTLEEANQRIKQILASRHQLLLTVSHDIKSPLNSILGYLELSKEGRNLSQEDLTSMQYSGQHILALLENLLNFSSIEQGNLQLTPTTFNPQELCMEISKMFESLAKRKQLHFAHHFDFDNQLMVSSDTLKIKQILTNLLSNAIKYTSEGGVMFTASYKNRQLYFQIIDTGTGIPQKDQARIYEAFTRIENNSNLAEGSGFGLFVVKGLIQRLKGEIHLTSDKGKGTRFEVYIPANEEMPSSPSVQSSSGKHILVVDDDLPFLTMVVNMLTQLGHVSAGCSDMDVFEKEIRQVPPYDYILTDMEMGTFNGMDVLASIQKNHSPVPVYIMTARSDINPIEIKSKGFAAYLRKPLTLQTLYEQFGGKIKKEKEPSLLEEVLENDPEVIREVLQQFLTSSYAQIATLKEALSHDDFATAQTICHKMLSMYLQIGASEVTPFLQKMDLLHGKEASSYPQWKEDLKEMIFQAERWRQRIEEQLASD